MVQNDRICRIENIGYFCDRNTGSIYSFDFTNGMIRLEDDEKSECQCYRKYRFCLFVKNKLYCIPDRSKEIKVYDLKNKSSKYIFLGNEERYTILNAWVIGDILWLVSMTINKIFKINLKSYKVSDYEIFDDKELLCGYKCDLYNSTLFIVALNSKKIVEFNLEKNEKKIFIPDVDEQGFSIALCINGELILTGQSYNLYKVNCKNHTVEKVGNLLAERKEEEESCLAKGPVCIFAERIGEDMLLIPSGYSQYRNCVFYVKFNEGIEFKKYNFENIIKESEEFVPEYIKGRIVGLYGEKTSLLYEINVDTGDVNVVQEYWERDSLKQIIGNGATISEGYSGIALTDYIENISKNIH